MRITTSFALTVALSSLVSALPTSEQLRFGEISKSALDWTAQTISTAGDGGVHSATTWGWLDCGLPTDAITIKSLRLSPDPPKPGQNLTIYASGTANTLIASGAYADVVVKLGLIKLISKRFDVCEELGNANSTLQCPIEPNDYDVVQTVALPSQIPRAKFGVQARAFTQTAAPMACVNIEINFLAPDAPPK